MPSTSYDWGYHSSDEQYVHVSLRSPGGRVEDLFDVTLYDPNETDAATGLDCQTQSLNDLKRLLVLANAALAAGLDPAGPEPPSPHGYVALAADVD